MSDPETVDAIRDVIFEGCPLRELLKKPCPHFGTSGSCRDCTYDWMTIAGNVRKVADKRRASYEKEHEKVKELKKELIEKNVAVSENEELVLDIGKGLLAFSRALDMAMKQREKEDSSEPEETDGGQSSGENTEGKEG